MTRFLFALAFALGAAAVIWVGLGLLGSSPVALIATLLIAVVYATGFVELLRFRQATAVLTQRLQSLPASVEALHHWLASLPAALRSPVHRRIEGEPAALPGPTLTPYLTGLLVMLGLLGTFIGMIVTLRGAVTALEGSTELHAIRSALAAPIAGMSLAFGTSIAGVAASAMLGLAATLSRRDRMLASRELDGKLGEALKPFSLKHQRQETHQALQSQARAFPDVVAQLQTLAGRMEQMGGQLSGALTNNQQQFHEGISRQYRELAASVADTLKTSLTESARLVAENTQPVMETALDRLNEQALSTHQRLNDLTEGQLARIGEQFRATTEQTAQSWRSGVQEHQQSSAQLAESISASLAAHNEQFQRHGNALLEQTRSHHDALQTGSTQHLATLSDRFQHTTERAAEHWRAGLDAQQQTSAQLADTVSTALEQHHQRFQQNSRALLDQIHEQQQQLHQTSEQHLTTLAGRFQSTAAELLNGQQTGLENLVARVGDALSALRDQEAERARAATDRLASLEGTVARHLASLGTALEEPMTRLIETASQTPKAAAEVITRLREEMGKNSERDNELLDERRRIMTELDTLLSTQREAATAQREALEALIRDSSQVLTDVGQAFSTHVTEQAGKLDQVTAEVTGSAQEVASLSDAFATAVQLFSTANDKLVDNLQRIETALEQSSARSDEQLAYYVEQAREVIDLSMVSQKEVLDALGALRTQTNGPV